MHKRPTTAHLPRRMREARKSQGLTVNVVAERVGVTPGQIRHYESGRNEPSATRLKKIADALNKTVEWLLQEPEPSLDMQGGGLQVRPLNLSPPINKMPETPIEYIVNSFTFQRADGSIRIPDRDPDGC
jgi:transcriptional regulator with XRE-family HTH domain